jgi:hypothetical protein
MNPKKQKMLSAANAGGPKRKREVFYDPRRGGHQSFSVLLKNLRGKNREIMEESMVMMMKVKKNIRYLIKQKGWTHEQLRKISDANGKPIRMGTVNYFGEEPGYKSVQLSTILYIAWIFSVHPMDLLYRDLEDEGFRYDRR